MNAYETNLSIETTSTALLKLHAIQNNLQRRRSFSRNFHSSYYIIIPVSNKIPHASPPRALN